MSSCPSLSGVGRARVRVSVTINVLSEALEQSISQSQNTVMIEHVQESCS